LLNVGKWWTTEQILDMIAPTAEEVEPVIAWLRSHGITKIDVSGRDFIKAQATIGLIERMFKNRNVPLQIHRNW
jgi:subtilase family serine protease